MKRILFAVLSLLLIVTFTLAQHGVPNQKSLTVNGMRSASQPTNPIMGKPVGPTLHFGTPTFSDNFHTGKLDTSKWIEANWKAADNRPGLNDGQYVPGMLDFSQGMLRIEMTQTKGQGNVVISRGGAIQTKEKFQYGRFDVVMRQTSTSPTATGAGQTLTGAVSSTFIYNSNSESEIDIEFLGDKFAMMATNWHNQNPAKAPTGSCKHTDATAPRHLGEGFHTYTVLWLPKSVEWYVDGQIVARHTDHVPSTPATVIIQHRGTNSPLWGGNASVGVTRYTYIKSFAYTPLGGK